MTEDEQVAVWHTQLDANDDLASYNKHVVPVMKSNGDVFKLMAATEAKKRGYAADKDAGVYIQAPQPLNLRLVSGHGITRVDWIDGTLYCQYSNSPKVYEFEKVPEQWFHNLLNSSHPDSLWAGYRKRLEVRAAEQPSLQG